MKLIRIITFDILNFYGILRIAYCLCILPFTFQTMPFCIIKKATYRIAVKIPTAHVSTNALQEFPGLEVWGLPISILMLTFVGGHNGHNGKKSTPARGGLSNRKSNNLFKRINFSHPLKSIEVAPFKIFFAVAPL